MAGAHVNQLRLALVRVLSPDGRPYGFGLLAADGKVVTCAHVVAASLGEEHGVVEAPTRRVRLDFPFQAPGQVLTAAVAAWTPMEQDGTGDVAGLVLDDPAPPSARPIPLARDGDLDGHPVQTYGYQGLDSSGTPTWVSGVIIARTEQGWLQLGPNSTDGLAVRQGFSGSPVWNRQTGQVVGLINQAWAGRKPVWLGYAIPGEQVHRAWDELEALPSCPFRPLTAFAASDRDIFFGRDDLSRQVVDEILASDACLVVGASGDGKTSLMRAGVTPAMRARGVAVLIIRPLVRDTLWGTIAAAVAWQDPREEPLEREVRLAARFDQGTVQDRLSVLADVLGAERLVLVVDQFEYLTREQTGRAATFVDDLRQIPQVRRPSGGPVCRLALVARDDAEPEIRALAGYERLLDGRMEIGPLTREQLRAAIEEPVRATGVLRFETGLVDKIIDDVRVQPYCLPALQVILNDLWNAGQSLGLLRFGDYHELSREGPLTEHLERVWREELTGRDRSVARHLLLHLVVPLGRGQFARRIAGREEIDDEEWEAAGTLANQRLVVLSSGPAGASAVELIHDALIEQWPTLADHLNDNRDLIEWRDELRRRIAAWMSSGRHVGMLAGRPDLARAAPLLRDCSAGLTTREREYLDRSRRRQRVLRRRMVVAVAAFLVCSMLAVGGSVLGVRRSREAHRADLREAATRVAATAAEFERGGSDGTGLLLAMVSDDLAAQTGTPTTVFESLAQDSSSLLKIVRPASGRFDEAALAPDGRTAVLATDTGMVNVIDTDDGTVLWSRQYGSGFVMARDYVQISAVAFGGADIAAVATSDRQVLILQNRHGRWDLARTLDLGVASQRSSARFERNKADLLAFDAKAERLVAYGSFGLVGFSVVDPKAPTIRCPAADRATGMRVTGKTRIILTHPSRVDTVLLPSCRTDRLLAAPTGVTLNDADVDSAGRPYAVGTLGAQLVRVNAGGAPVVLADRGPYQNPVLTGVADKPTVSAASSLGTFAWQLDNGQQVFGLRSAGRAISASERVVWLHDGLAELHDPAADAVVSQGGFYYPAIGVTTGWTGHDLVVGRTPQPVVVLRDAYAQVTEPPRFAELPSPDGWDLAELATDPDGPWAAGIFRKDQDGVARRQLVAWDVTATKAVPTDINPSSFITAVAFGPGRLIVGFRNGVIQVFQLVDGSWASTVGTRLPGPVVSLAASGNTVTAVTYDSLGGDPTVVRLSHDSLDHLASRRLPGPAGAAHIAALPNGMSAVAYGPGKVAVLDDALNVRWSPSNEGFEYVTGVYPVPNRNQFIVSGRLRNITLDFSRRSVLSDRRWSKAGAITGASASLDGKRFATYDYAGMKLTVWSTDPALLRQRSCAVIGRDLTPEEWQRHVGDIAPYRPVCGRR